MEHGPKIITTSLHNYKKNHMQRVREHIKYRLYKISN
jgi:hypothetical protein